jgi:dienelactone hydrolase
MTLEELAGVRLTAAARVTAKPRHPARAVIQVRLLLVVPLLLANAATAPAGPATDKLVIRGQAQTLRVYGSRGTPAAVVASGDGGWVHLGPDVADFLAASGYFVVGFDSKAYLSSFTSGSQTLATSDIPADFAQLVDYAARGAPSAPLLVGVSEGAALAVVAAGDPALKAKVLGLLALGLPQKAELGWRFRDSIIYLTKGVPKEPTFDASDFVGRVAPLPLVAIHSTHDEFVPVAEIQGIMARAGEPKQLHLVDGQNHRFSGQESALHARILEAVAWMQAQRP